MKIKNLFLWLMQIVVAIILLQTVYFKFSGSPESIYIFSKIGLESWGRYLSGSGELIASILLLTPYALIGAIIALIIIIPAIIFHLTSLGIEVMDDGGLLFGLALIVFIFSILIVYIRRKDFSRIISKKK